MNISMDKRGPIFDGQAEKAVAEACEDMEKTIATLGAAHIRQTMNTTFKTQTPYYRLRNVAAPEAPGWKIWDQGVIYGPWLEGTGSRNRTTRFKGYRIYRTAVKTIQERAIAIGQSVLVKYMGRMN